MNNYSFKINFTSFILDRKYGGYTVRTTQSTTLHPCTKPCSSLSIAVSSCLKCLLKISNMAKTTSKSSTSIPTIRWQQVTRKALKPIPHQ